MNMKLLAAAFILTFVAAAGLGRADEPNPYAPGGDGWREIPSPRKSLGHGAKSAVFIIDCSESMKAHSDLLKEQLQKTLEGLPAESSFAIMTFADGKCEMVDKKLLVATPANKQKAHEFLTKMKPKGKPDPIAALRAAFAAKPEAVYLLTAGNFSKNKEVIAEIRKLNDTPKVRIDTIEFCNRDHDCEQLMQEIAEENGGLFKFVSDSELKK